MLTVETDPQGGNDDRLSKVYLVRAAISGCSSDGRWARASIMLTSHCAIVACFPGAPGCPISDWVLGTEKSLGRELIPGGEGDPQTDNDTELQSCTNQGGSRGMTCVVLTG